MKMKSHTSLTTKIIFFILTIVLFSISVICILSANYMINSNLYHIREQEFLFNRYETLILQDMHEILPYSQEYSLHNTELLEEFCRQRNFVSVEIWKIDAERTPENTLFVWENDSVPSGYTSKHKWKVLSANNHYLWDGFFDRSGNIRYVKITLTQIPNSIADHYMKTYLFVSTMYSMRFLVFVIGFLSITTTILCFIFLMRIARKSNIEPGKPVSKFFHIPFDVGTIMGFISIRYLLKFARYLLNFVYYADSTYNNPLEDTLIWIMLSFLAIESIFLSWSMKLSKHIHHGNLNKPQLMFPIATKVLRVTPIIAQNILCAFRRLPFLWKTIIILILCLFQGYDYLSSQHELLLARVILPQLIVQVGLILYFALMFQKLQKASSALSSGDLTYKINTRFMIWDMKEHGNHLNNIANVTSAAIEEQMKSERMKTELITNVSHDIKTPITSIINYTVFLEKEIQQKTGDMKKIAEYTDVLQRQSVRLKQLLDDLVQVSKAATGNLEVNLEPCDTSMLLAQAAGEYEQRMNTADLILVMIRFEEPLPILADVQLLWRIFDNLFNNICKYAQAGTRVYLTLEKQNDFAVITLKNTSRDALNISPQELMERFVRGDASRHTEGNGLGLSITKTLMELQKGSMDLTIDGDLFKVTLQFPLLHPSV